MPTKRVPESNMRELLEAIDDAQTKAWWNNVWGHLSTILSAVGVIGVALLASDRATDTVWHGFLIAWAALPPAVTIFEKALRPAQWEAWYARKALALSAIVRHVQSSNPPEGKPNGDGSLKVQIVDWWNLVDEEFEKTRPTWGPRDLSETEKVRVAGAPK